MALILKKVWFFGNTILKYYVFSGFQAALTKKRDRIYRAAMLDFAHGDLLPHYR